LCLQTDLGLLEGARWDICLQQCPTVANCAAINMHILCYCYICSLITCCSGTPIHSSSKINSALDQV
uniref:Uncharacterized protein n=1 Tax=Macaca fascicularis TaxID=9541 RepID=A0A7N9CHI8_MACFA